MLSRTHVQTARLVLLAGALMLLAPAVADAATSHGPVVMAGIPVFGGLASDVGSVFSSIGGAVLGAFSWTIGLASKFILTTIAALVHMLIPQSWLHKGLEITQWIVSVPDYGAKIASPSGGTVYGFGGINALRGVFGWLGIAVAPLTLVYATSRAMIGEGDPVGVPLLRTVVIALVIVSYPYWWDQGAALVNQITNVILSVPQVASGLNKLMEYAVGGVALGGWQLIDLGLMGAVAVELLGLIFMKVVVILVGAWLYATGPVMIGLVPTREGSALARAWGTAVIGILALGVAWASLFAVGAVLINDSSTAGPLIAGNTGFGSLIGGVLLAVAGLASLWVCLKVAREAGSLLRMQLGGLLTLGARGSSSASSGTGRLQRSTGRSVRDFGQRLGAASRGTAGELGLAVSGAGPAGAAVARSARAIGQVGRRGLIGTAAAGLGAAGDAAAPTAAATFSRSRAGAVAVRMGRAGTAGWQQAAARQDSPSGTRSVLRADPTAGEGALAGGRGGRGSRSGQTSTSRAAGRPGRYLGSAANSFRRWTRPSRDNAQQPIEPRSRPGRNASSQVSSRPGSTRVEPRQPGNETEPSTGGRPVQRTGRQGSSSSQNGGRPDGSVGASASPRPAGPRRSGRASRPVTPSASPRSRPHSSTPAPIAPEPRSHRPFGARLARPFHNRKAGR